MRCSRSRYLRPLDQRSRWDRLSKESKAQISDCVVALVSLRWFLSWSNWNLEMLILVEGGNPENQEKTPRSKARANDKLNQHMAPRPESKPGPHIVTPVKKVQATMLSFQNILIIRKTSRVLQFSSHKGWCRDRQHPDFDLHPFIVTSQLRQWRREGGWGWETAVAS